MDVGQSQFGTGRTGKGAESQIEMDFPTPLLIDWLINTELMTSSLISSQLRWEQTQCWNFVVAQSQFGTGSTGKGRGQDGLVNEVLINEVASTSASAPVAAEFLNCY